jgi:ribulose-phosphate 3-epimerase
MSIIAPSLLAANFTDLKSEIEMFNKSEADWLHLDVMDGVFVPNISFGIPIIKAIKPLTSKPFDVHLMIIEPEKYISAFHKAGADILTVHYEACPHLHRTMQEIKAQGMMTGVAINPHTSITVLEDILELIDVVCIMSVNPGFGGQKFIENTLNKVNQLKSKIIQNNTKTKIEIDGGVNLENAPKLLDCGADILVAGSTVFKSEQPIETIQLLKKAEAKIV